MATYSVAHAQAHLPDLLERARRGETVEVANDQGVTVKLELIAEEPSLTEMARRRRLAYGSMPELRAIPDSAFAPLPQEEWAEWERLD